MAGSDRPSGGRRDDVPSRNAADATGLKTPIAAPLVSRMVMRTCATPTAVDFRPATDVVNTAEYNPFPTPISAGTNAPPVWSYRASAGSVSRRPLVAELP